MSTTQNEQEEQPHAETRAAVLNSRTTLRYVFEFLIAGSMPKVICDLAGVKQPRAGIIIASCLIMAAVFESRQLIRRHISAVVAIILLVASMAAAICILLSQQEIVTTYPTTMKALPDVSRYFRAATEDITMFGTNFYITPVQEKEAFLDRLNNGVSITVLIFDPTPSAGSAIAKEVGIDAAVFQTQVETSLAALIDIQKRWDKMRLAASRPGNLDIRIYTDTPRTRIYMFDQNRETGITILITYFNHVPAVEMPALVMRNQKGGFYEKYRDGVLKMREKERSTPLKEWLRIHRPNQAFE